MHNLLITKSMLEIIDTHLNIKKTRTSNKRFTTGNFKNRA